MLARAGTLLITFAITCAACAGDPVDPGEARDAGEDPRDGGAAELDAGPIDPEADPDEDGLTNQEELAFARLTSSPPGCRMNLARKSLALELDSMSGRALDDATLEVVTGAFAAAGVDLCIYRDEETIMPADVPGDPSLRGALLEAHGPRFDDRGSPRIPYEKMIHAMIVTRRTDSAERGGDTLFDPGGDVDKTGILIYRDALDALHPACATAQAPAIVVEEALAGSLVHELGHTLQLGHDTDVGGGVVHWNIMSVLSSCSDAQMRTHGEMNADPSLGNTESVSAPRFSEAAAALMSFTRKISVEVSQLDVENGYEM